MNTGTGNVGLKCSEKLDAVHSNKNSSFKFWWFSEVNETAFSLIFSEKRTTFQGILIFFFNSFPFHLSFLLFGNSTIFWFYGNFPSEVPYCLSPFWTFCNFGWMKSTPYWAQSYKSCLIILVTNSLQLTLQLVPKNHY